AAASFREAIRLDPKHARAHYNLGLALRDKGELDAAIASFQAEIRLYPKFPPAHNALAWLLAAGPDGVRNSKQAIEHATWACELTAWKVPYPIATLAAAHAEAGNFDRAVEFQKKALSFPDFEKEQGKVVQERLEMYERKMPCRDPALVP